MTSWSGKVCRLKFDSTAGLKILEATFTGPEARLRFSSPYGPRDYVVEATSELGPGRWAPVEPVTVLPEADNQFTVRFANPLGARGFFRVRVRP